MNDPLDVDSAEYVTLAAAMKRTSRSRRTIGRWVKSGAVRVLDLGDVRGYHLDDLLDAEAQAHANATRVRTQ